MRRRPVRHTLPAPTGAPVKAATQTGYARGTTLDRRGTGEVPGDGMTSRAARSGIARWRSPEAGLGLAWLALAALATLPFFWYGFEGLAQEWTRPEYRFKPLVPAFSFLLFLQVLRSVPPRPASDGTRWLGLVGIGGALLLALLGNLVGILDFVFVAMILWIASLIILCFGLRRAFLFWAPVASLFLALPLPQFVVAAIHGILRGLAADLGIALLWLARVPVHLEGQIVDFAVYQVRLNEATAGLVNFLPVMLVLFFFATAYRGPLWSRLLPLLLAAPTLVLLAALKIVAIGLALHRGGGEAAETVLRLGGEWTIFAICVLVLVGLVAGLRRAIEGPIRHRIDLDIGALLTGLARASRLRATPPIVAASLMTVLAALVVSFAPSRPPPAIERAPFSHFPPDIGAWQGSATAIPPGVAQILAADDYVHLDFYHRDERAPVNLWVAYYLEQTSDQSGIHSPEICLPNEGWNIVSFRTVDIPLEGTAAGRVEANRAVIRKEGETALVYYWFDGRGRRLANERLAKILVKFDGLLTGRTDGALVRYVTSILPDETEAEAEARLLRLMRESVDHLPRYVPG
jgi:exosortase D (VPLPA-CTERM-specific)